MGNVWFAQSNTGKLAKFDPSSESFTEYDNPLWPKTEPCLKLNPQ
jgi:virginiamycin B lyase